MLAAANARQLAAAAFATGLSTQRLKHYASGAGGLDAMEVQKLADFLLKNAYMIKSGERDGAAIGVSGAERSRRRGARA
jgi:hypothetical protein